MFPLPQPILADLATIIQAIVFLVILASGAAKMFRESKEVQRRAERPRPRPQPQRAQRPRAAGEARAAADPQGDVRSEVEQFLRRANQAEQRQQPQAQAAEQRRQPPPRRPQRIEVLDDQQSGFDVDARPRQTYRKSPQQVRETQPREMQPPPRPQAAPPHPESVAEHVAGRMGRDEFVQRASHLGEELSQTDERLEARLHQKFDHRLGSLSARRLAREADDKKLAGELNADTLADNLLEQLSTPQGVQQAIVISELINRPTERW